MSDKETAKSVIDSYRRRQQRSQRLPMIIMIFAAILLIVGAAAIIFYILGPDDQSLLAFRNTETPTATNTSTATYTVTPSPIPTETGTLPPTDTPEPSETPTPSGPFIYRVQEGDSLFSIAEQFNTDLLTILALNPQIDPTTLIIRVGDEILIPTPDTELPTSTPLPEGIPPWTIIDYTVVFGDTLEAIALSFNSTVEAIVEENELENANDIFIGQILKIPVNIVTPVPTATEGTVFPTAEIEATDTPQP
jgi:LysM repeat protein